MEEGFYNLLNKYSKVSDCSILKLVEFLFLKELRESELLASASTSNGLR